MELYSRSWCAFSQSNHPQGMGLRGRFTGNHVCYNQILGFPGKFSHHPILCGIHDIRIKMWDFPTKTHPAIGVPPTSRTSPEVDGTSNLGTSFGKQKKNVMGDIWNFGKHLITKLVYGEHFTLSIWKTFDSSNPHHLK